jgi:hypothetical protein
VARDIDGVLIDVTGHYFAAQQLCRSNRQNSRSGSDIQQAAVPVPLPQPL